MSDPHHTWEIGNEAPIIRAHSITKHEVLRAYLERYVQVLTAHVPRQQLRLTLVDGFAGGGEYRHYKTKELCDGSPMLMLNAMETARTEAQAKRTKAFNLDVTFVFVERNAKALEYLRQLISESKFRTLLNDKIHFHHSRFSESLSRILDRIKRRGSRDPRSIFVLDQFGYKDAPLHDVRRILASSKNAEVILTFATDHLIDYLTTDERTQQTLHKVGIELPSSTIQTAKEQRDWKHLIQRHLYKELWVRSGAAYFTPFFIRSPDSRKDYWFIHFSQHHRARDVMTTLHCIASAEN